VILKIVGGEYRAFSSAFLRSLEVSGVYDWYDACATSGENKKEEEMTKSKSIFCMSLLAATLIAPTARGFADDDDRHDSRNQRQDLRQDQQQLEQLRQQRDREIREGDKRETREYNSKIRNLEKDMRREGKI
jgi:hypothetical protein